MWWPKNGNAWRYLAIGGKIYPMVTWAKQITVVSRGNGVTTYHMPKITREMEGSIMCTGQGNRKTIKLKMDKSTSKKPETMAYDCSEAEAIKVGPMTQASRELMQAGVLLAPTTWRHEFTQAIVGGYVYNVTCKKASVTIIDDKGLVCYAGEAQPAVMQGKDEVVFVDRYGYVIPKPARIECPPSQRAYDRVTHAVKRHIDKTHAIEDTAQALIGTPFRDMSTIFNKYATYSLIVLAEICLCGTNLSSLVGIYLLYRKYAALGTLVLTIMYLAWTVALFLVATCMQIPICKALRLIFPSFRRYKDLIALRRERQMKLDKQRHHYDRIERDLDPTKNYDDIMTMHLGEVYKCLTHLNKKVAKLEQKLRQEPLRRPARHARPVLRAYRHKSMLENSINGPGNNDCRLTTITEAPIEVEITPEQSRTAAISSHQQPSATTSSCYQQPLAEDVGSSSDNQQPPARMNVNRTPSDHNAAAKSSRAGEATFLERYKRKRP